jgi:hypothetical protein
LCSAVFTIFSQPPPPGSFDRSDARTGQICCLFGGVSDAFLPLFERAAKRENRIYARSLILNLCGREKFMNRINVAGKGEREKSRFDSSHLYRKIIFPGSKARRRGRKFNLGGGVFYSAGLWGSPIDLCSCNVNKLGNSWAGSSLDADRALQSLSKSKFISHDHSHFNTNSSSAISAMGLLILE